MQTTAPSPIYAIVASSATSSTVAKATSLATTTTTSSAMAHVCRSPHHCQRRGRGRSRSHSHSRSRSPHQPPPPPPSPPPSPAAATGPWLGERPQALTWPSRECPPPPPDEIQGDGEALLVRLLEHRSLEFLVSADCGVSSTGVTSTNKRRVVDARGDNLDDDASPSAPAASGDTSSQ